MDQAFKISFIVTAYNLPADMLTACVSSILALPLEEHEREIIVVDDGSDTPAMNGLAEHRDALTYTLQPNQGVSAARNTGLRMATGTYIQFVDGDDCLLPQYGHCVDIMRHQHPDVVLFDFTFDEDAPQSSFKDIGPMEGNTYMRHHNLRGAVWGLSFKRTILLSLQFTKGVRYGEDEEFTPQLLLRAERVFKTDAKAYFYRQHEASALHQNDQQAPTQRLKDNIGVIERLHFLANTGNEADREALQRRVAQLTMDYVYNVITLTRDYPYLEECVRQLREKGLFPLPDRDYTRKYKWFRRMTMTKMGRRLLCTLLPKLP